MTNKIASEVLKASSIQQMSFCKVIVDGKLFSVKEALDIAIKALEQEPCEDCISRQAVLDKLNRLIEVERLQGTDEMGYGRERVSAYESMIFEINSKYLYPSVNPQKPCEDCISRQAVLNGLASIAKVKARSDAQKSLMGRIMFFVEQLPPVTPIPEPYKAESEVEE